jgi:hypothetical protein
VLNRGSHVRLDCKGENSSRDQATHLQPMDGVCLSTNFPASTASTALLKSAPATTRHMQDAR